MHAFELRMRHQSDEAGAQRQMTEGVGEVAETFVTPFMRGSPRLIFRCIMLIGVVVIARRPRVVQRVVVDDRGNAALDGQPESKKQRQ